MGKHHFHIERKEPTHSLLPSSQTIHRATHGVSLNQAGGGAAETGSAARHFCAMCKCLSRGKVAKDSSQSCNQTHKTGILLPLQLMHGYWDRHLLYTSKSLQAAFARSCLGLKTSVMFPVQPQGTKKYSAAGMKSANARVMVSSCKRHHGEHPTR